jgi:hypothetical protein
MKPGEILQGPSGERLERTGERRKPVEGDWFIGESNPFRGQPRKADIDFVKSEREILRLIPPETPPPAKCGKPAASFIPRWGMSFACVLPKGHERKCERGGCCVVHGEYRGEHCPKWPECAKQLLQTADERKVMPSDPDEISTRRVPATEAGSITSEPAGFQDCGSPTEDSNLQDRLAISEAALAAREEAIKAVVDAGCTFRRTGKGLSLVFPPPAPPVASNPIAETSEPAPPDAEAFINKLTDGLSAVAANLIGARFYSAIASGEIIMPGASPAESSPHGLTTRFAEFDDDDHPAQKWWKEHGQYHMSGGGRREFIWACRGWIAREQLYAGVPVTGDSLHEKPPAASPLRETPRTLVDILKRGWVAHGYYGKTDYGDPFEQFFGTDEAKIDQVDPSMKLRFILPDLTKEEIKFLLSLRDGAAASLAFPGQPESCCENGNFGAAHVCLKHPGK